MFGNFGLAKRENIRVGERGKGQRGNERIFYCAKSIACVCMLWFVASSSFWELVIWILLDVNAFWL